MLTLQWRHNELDGISNHRRLYCVCNRLFRRRSNEISKLRVTGLCTGISPVTGEFPAQMASIAEFFFHFMTSPCLQKSCLHGQQGTRSVRFNYILIRYNMRNHFVTVFLLNANLASDPSTDYEKFEKIISKTYDKYFPEKRVKFDE